MNKINEIWEVYRACWNNENPAERKIKLKGSEQLSDYMGEFQKEFSGASFIVTDFHLHHDRSLAHWNMVDSEQQVIANGIDFAQYKDGKLKYITGFFKEN